MTKIKWLDHLYSIDVAEIDEQHKHLIAMLNHLHDSMQSGQGHETVTETIVSIVSYIKEHFASEEKLMAQIKFSGIELQKRQHAEFAHEVTIMLERMRKGEQVSPYQLHSLLKEWLTNHIQNEDKKIGVAIRRLSATTAEAKTDA